MGHGTFTVVPVGRTVVRTGSTVVPVLPAGSISGPVGSLVGPVGSPVAGPWLVPSVDHAAVGPVLWLIGSSGPVAGSGGSSWSASLSPMAVVRCRSPSLIVCHICNLHLDAV